MNLNEVLNALTDNSCDVAALTMMNVIEAVDSFNSCDMDFIEEFADDLISDDGTMIINNEGFGWKDLGQFLQKMIGLQKQGVI